MFPEIFCDDQNYLGTQPDKDPTRKENFRLIFPTNTNILSKRVAKRIQ
jgi:hypothetical protein